MIYQSIKKLTQKLIDEFVVMRNHFHGFILIDNRIKEVNSNVCLLFAIFTKKITP